MSAVDLVRPRSSRNTQHALQTHKSTATLHDIKTKNQARIENATHSGTMTQSATIPKKGNLLVFLHLIVLGIGALCLDEGRRVSVSPASPQCPGCSCKFGFLCGCATPEKEYPETPIVVDVGYKDQYGQALPSNQAQISTNFVPSVLAGFVVFMAWFITLAFAWYHKLHHVACGTALLGFALFGVVTCSVYLSIGMPEESILRYLVAAYATPIVVGILYEHFCNT